MQPFVVLMAKLHDVLVKVSESCGGTAAASAAKRSALLFFIGKSFVTRRGGAQNGSMRRANFWKCAAVELAAELTGIGSVRSACRMMTGA